MYDQAQSLRELVGKAETAAPSGPKVLSITSGKGGVGKSTLSANLALALSQLGKQVLLIDADFGLANIDVMLGVPALYNLGHFLSRERALSDIVQQGRGGVRFISGGSGLPELLQMNDSQLDGLLDELLELWAPNDYILIDTSAGVTETVLRLTQASHQCIVVTTPEPTSILDAYALLKTMLKYPPMPALSLIMIKADSQRDGDSATQSFVRITSKYLNLEIAPLGCILYDNEVSRSIRQQEPVLLSNPKSPASRCIQTVAHSLLQLPQPTQEAQSFGALSRLFGRLRGQK